MLEKFNAIYENIMTDAKKPIKRKRVRVKNVKTAENVNQFCEGETKRLKVADTQKKNVK